jgi:hypothetical protein
MTKTRIIGVGAAILCLGAFAFGGAPASADCDVPALSTQAKTPFTTQSSCSAGGASGSAIGRNAGGGQPKRLCVNLLQGTDASSGGFDGANGNAIPTCVKHDSTTNGLESCRTTGCDAATHHDLEVDS